MRLGGGGGTLTFGQNLTNKFYFDQGYNVGGDGFDFDHVFVGGPPRTFGIELIKKFGKYTH